MVIDALSPLDINLLRKLIQNAKEDGYVYYSTMNLDTQRLFTLADKRYVALYADNCCQLLPLGYTAVSDFDEQAARAAAKEQKEERKLRAAARRQWIIALLGLTWSVATFFVGLLINSDAPIKQTIVALFKRVLEFFQ